jgi:hypothetical protein
MRRNFITPAPLLFVCQVAANAHPFTLIPSGCLADFVRNQNLYRL